MIKDRMSPRYEYRVESTLIDEDRHLNSYPKISLEEGLNVLAKEGWRLVAVVDGAHYFEREQVFGA